MLVEEDFPARSENALGLSHHLVQVLHHAQHQRGHHNVEAGISKGEPPPHIKQNSHLETLPSSLSLEALGHVGIGLHHSETHAVSPPTLPGCHRVSRIGRLGWLVRALPPIVIITLWAKFAGDPQSHSNGKWI